MKHNVTIIIPYFGKLPSNFPLWLKSTEYNKDFNWLLFLDDKRDFNYPKNVKTIYTDFHSIKLRFQELFDFPIVLNSAYKLCDFKPIYGLAFQEYIKDSDFWGFGDIDLLYGDLKKFITDEVLSNNDRVYRSGHLSLFRNNEYMNNAFKLTAPNLPTFKEAFTKNTSCYFDEGGGISPIFVYNNIKQYTEIDMADIYFFKYKPELTLFGTASKSRNYKGQEFFYINNRIIRKYKKGNKFFEDEFCYLHHQKRDIRIIESHNGDYKLDSLTFYPIGLDYREEKRRVFEYYKKVYKRYYESIKRRIGLK